MRWFGRFSGSSVIYPCFVGIFLLFLIHLVTFDKIENPPNEEAEKSDVPEKLPILETLKTTVQSRFETNESTGTPCQPLHYIPHAETRPVTALVSFPGSGNTWLRYLIQQSSGVHTGSQFVDNTLVSRGFPGEPVFNASVAVVKTHQRGINIRSKFQKAVLLIRHPKPAIQSLFNLYSQGHTGCAPKTAYQSENGNYWLRFFNRYIGEWEFTNVDWINKFKGPLHVVLYDQLRHDLGPTLRSLLQFLDLPLNETALQCTVEHSEGLYHRKSCEDSFDPFTEGMKKRIEIVEKHVWEAVKKYT